MKRNRRDWSADDARTTSGQGQPPGLSVHVTVPPRRPSRPASPCPQPSSQREEQEHDPPPFLRRADVSSHSPTSAQQVGDRRAKVPASSPQYCTALSPLPCKTPSPPWEVGPGSPQEGGKPRSAPPTRRLHSQNGGAS
jgi:hypothetical protein